MQWDASRSQTSVDDIFNGGVAMVARPHSRDSSCLGSELKHIITKYMHDMQFISFT